MRPMGLVFGCMILAFQFISIDGFAQTGEGPFSLTRGRAFNPDIGVNLLGLARATRFEGISEGAFSLQEVELAFLSDVDPYFRAAALISLHAESHDGHEDFVVHPEEVFFETISLPVVSLKAGKFKAALGRHNLLHTHAYPFVDAPLFQDFLLGDEGMSDVGFSSSALLPLPWFSELTLQLFRGRVEPAFESKRQGELAYVGHFAQLWDLSDALTARLGLSGATGPSHEEENAKLYGADLTFKWRPAEGGKYRSWAWSMEFLAQAGDEDHGEEASRGVSTWLQYQFAQRWWVQGRLEYLGAADRDGQGGGAFRKQSVLLGFFPSEFSGFRVQYDHLSKPSDSREHRLALQWNISIGAHPAHAY